MKSKVSVIIPTYGGEDSVIRSVKSVLSQNYKNFEVIIVDDNNPDTEERKKTEGYIKAFLYDSRVKYIKHEKNKNGSAARNTGFKNSDGDYICLLDDDDIFLQDKLSAQVEFLEEHPEYGACYCWRKQNGKEICGEYEGDLSKVLLDLSFTPTTDSLMIRKECYEALGGFDESYRRHQDFEFLLRFFKKYKIGVVKRVLIEVIGNKINNVPKGEKLYNTKKAFFDQFGDEIDMIDKKNKGYKQRAYAEHFSRTFKDMIRYGYFGWAIKVYFKYGYKGGIYFWKIFFKCCFDGIRERMGMR